MNGKKIDKDFVLSDSSVNCYGYRLMTDGYQMDRFLKNPIGYYMHERDKGVLVKWEDLRVDGDKILGKPVINLDHPRGQQTVNEIEGGFLNAASMGGIMVLESHTEVCTDLNSEFDSILVVSKWFNGELSIVDQPGNSNAVVAELMDANNKPLILKNLIKVKNLNVEFMKINLEVTPDMVAILNLDNDFTAADLVASIKNLSKQAKKAETLKLEKTQLETDKADLTTQLEDLKAAGCKKEVEDLLGGALTAKKIDVKTQTQLAKDYATNPTGLKSLLSNLGAYKPITDAIDQVDEAAGKEYEGKSWDELMDSGKLADLKARNKPMYDALYNKTFGKK